MNRIYIRRGRKDLYDIYYENGEFFIDDGYRPNVSNSIIFIHADDQTIWTENGFHFQGSFIDLRPLFTVKPEFDLRNEDDRKLIETFLTL